MPNADHTILLEAELLHGARLLCWTDGDVLQWSVLLATDRRVDLTAAEVEPMIALLV